MEEAHILNPSDVIDVFCLHFVSFELVSKTVDSFRDGWNSHKVSGSKTSNKSPLQMFTNGLLELRAQGGYHAELNQVFLIRNNGRIIREKLVFSFHIQDPRFADYGASEAEISAERSGPMNARTSSTEIPLDNDERVLLDQSFDKNNVTLSHLKDNYVLVREWVQNRLH